MSERTKKILLIVGFIAVVVAVGTALYFAFFKPEAPVKPTVLEPGVPVGVLPTALEGAPTAAEEGIGIPEILLPEAEEVARGGLTQVTTLTTAEVASPTLSTDGKGMNYYDPNDGRFYSINQDGTVTALSNTQFPEAENVAWGTNGDKAVIEFPDGSNVIYDFDTEVQVTLPEHWEDFKFSPANDDIVAKSIGLDPNNRAIVISSDDGTNVVAVAGLGENADKIDIAPSPNDQVIAFSDTGETQAGFGRKQIIPIGKNEENYKGLIVEGMDFRSLWSPKGDMILYSATGTYSNNQPLLWTVEGSTNSLGDNRRSLGLNTWADKCTFADNAIVYCAVPQSLPASAGLQPVSASGVPDDFYMVNLTTGASNRVARPDQDVTASSLQVSDDGATLFFINQTTGLLQSIRLK